MNKLETKMVELLIELKNKYNVSGVKAEFEAEGTRIDEAMRLKDVITSAGLGLNIKIGGCEAIKDMLDAISLGAERVIGPMIETPYALQKFLKAAQMVYADRFERIEFLANIETITAYENFSDMLKIPEIKLLNGIVIGRVDFVGSLHWGRDAINEERVLKHCLILAEKAKEKGLKVVVGGGVSIDSLPFMKAFPKGYLDRFETRKIIFDAPKALNNPEIAFIKAVEFELMWLKNKQNHYAAIAKEDQDRIQMMEKRYQSSLENLRETVS